MKSKKEIKEKKLTNAEKLANGLMRLLQEKSLESLTSHDGKTLFFQTCQISQKEIIDFCKKYLKWVLKDKNGKEIDIAGEKLR